MRFFCFIFVMIRRLPTSTLTDPLFPYTTLFRSKEGLAGAGRADAEIDVMGGDRVQVSGLVAAAPAVCAALDPDRDFLRFDVLVDHAVDRGLDRKSTRLNSSH